MPSTSDLMDEHPDDLDVCESQFRQFGGVRRFAGRVRTVRCREDNILVRRMLETSGAGQVLVVHGDGSMRTALLGDMIGATDAAQYGLVNRVVLEGRAVSEAIAIAQEIAAKSPLTVAIGKSAFYAQAEMPLAEAYAFTAQVMVDNMMARDAEEGIGAFLEKRTPRWQGC